MANRYKSIIRNVVGDIAVQIDKLLEQVPDADWKAEDGQLTATIKGEKFFMTFEKDDPLTEALLLLLNNRAHVISALRNP